MKKVIAIVIFLGSTSLFFTLMQSCNKNPYGCPCEHIYFKLDSLDALQVKISDTGTYQMSKEKYLITDSILENESIAYNGIALRVNNFFVEEKSFISSDFSLGFTSALATVPLPNPVSFDYLHKVIITSSEDYNDTLPNGSNLAGIIQVHHDLSIWGSDLTDPISNEEIRSDFLLYTFKFAPAENKIHNLTIKYVLLNGSEVSTTINNVLIKKQ